MKYTGSIKYLEQFLTAGESFLPKKYQRIKIESNHPSYYDSEAIFSQDRYKYPYLPLCLGEYRNRDMEKLDINVLRMIIRLNSEDANVFLPKELMCLKEFIENNINFHRQHYPANKDCFVHLTVRTCDFEEMKVFAKASTWHVDGFQGTRIERHIPEQDVIWCNKNPTAVSFQPFFCEYLDSSKFDINDFFNRNQGDSYALLENFKQLKIKATNATFN